MILPVFPQVVPIATGRSPVIVGMIVAYFLVVAGISWWAARRTRTASDFFVAGGALGVIPMGIAAMAATLSGFAFIGGPGLVYTLGMGALHINLPLGITNALSAWVLGRQLRTLADQGVWTIPGAIRARYDSPLAQGLAAVAILVAVVGYLGTNFLALGIVLDAVLGTGLATGIWIGMAVTLAYSVTGGILAGVWADVFQGIVMAVASTLVFALAMSVGGGLEGITRAISPASPAFLSPWGTLSPLAALSLYFVFGIGALGQPHVVHKFFMLKDPRQLRWYPVVMTLAMTLTILLMGGVGLVVKALVARGELAPLARPDEATPVFLLRYASPALAGLVFAGVAAAIMSSVNSFLNVGAAAIAHDLPAAMGSTRSDTLRLGRLGTTGLALLGAVLAAISGTLVAFLGIFGWGLFASTLVAPLAIGLNWPRASARAAIASIAMGLGVTLILETAAYFRVFTFPSGVTATALALVLSILAFLIASRNPARGSKR